MDYDAKHRSTPGGRPAAGSGKHTHLKGGQGLASSGSPGSYEPGWVVSDNSNVAPTNANLVCNNYATWTSAAGNNENLPINCVNWFESYAFCIWDGGFLPSEAEAEYVTAGGSQEREYPWGATAPGTTNQYAIYGCNYPSSSGACTGITNIAPVGTATLGVGLWGQLDLAGSMFQWRLDWYATYVSPCSDCADVTPATNRQVQGGTFDGSLSGLAPPYRGADGATDRFGDFGFRCARAP